jgi:hypothetical protein
MVSPRVNDARTKQRRKYIPKGLCAGPYTKLARSGPITAPATIHGERESKTKRTQQLAGSRILSFLVRPAVTEKASNIQRSENGIALAKAKPRRPSVTTESTRRDAKAKEMQTIQPAIARAASAKRRFSAAWRL